MHVQGRRSCRYRWPTCVGRRNRCDTQSTGRCRRKSKGKDPHDWRDASMIIAGHRARTKSGGDARMRAGAQKRYPGTRCEETCKMARKSRGYASEQDSATAEHGHYISATMTRLRSIDGLFDLIVLLGLLFVGATDSKSLTLQPPVSKFQVQEQQRVALLEQGGRCQVVSIPAGEPASPPKRPGRERRVKHVKASLLTVGLFAVLIRNLFWVVSPSRNDWAGFVFLWALYLVEASTCSTRRYLSNIRTPAQVKDMIREFQEVAPRVRWNLECYHYEDDYRRSTASRRGPDSTSSKRVTHRASEVYEFQQWRDTTELKETLESLQYGSDDKTSYLKITLIKLVIFLDHMCYQDFLAQQVRFVAREGNRDWYTDTWASIEVDGFIPKLLVVRTVLGNEALVRMAIFWIFTLLGLTVPYRLLFSRNCDELDLVITKEVSGVFPILLRV